MDNLYNGNIFIKIYNIDHIIDILEIPIIIRNIFILSIEEMNIE